MNNKLVDSFIEVSLVGDSFLKVAETLSRIGIPSFPKKTVYQSCHILHKRGKYYIVHFKELFSLDGRDSTFSNSDKLIRDKIASLLQDWGLVKIVTPNVALSREIKVNNLKIVSHEEANNLSWKLEPKYRIGKKKKYNVNFGT